jgi:hypothetical protein
MCSNFGFNLHPGRTPCAIETQWYSGLIRLFNYLRARFSRNRLKLQSVQTHPIPFMKRRIRSK